MFKRCWPLLRRMSLCVPVLLVSSSAQAQTSTTPGDVTVYSTIYSIGVEWDIANDTDHDARVDVEYKSSTSSAWQPASALLRIDGNGRNMLAGSVMFLSPDTDYQVRLTLFDPDGGGESREVAVRTRRVPVAPVGGRVFHVVPGAGGGDGSPASPFGGVDAAQAIAQPGDTFLMHAGYYGSERLTFTAAGTADGYIAWKAAGDGEVTTTGLDIYASHLWFEGLTVRDQRYGTRTDRSPTDVVITRCAFMNNFYNIYLNGGGSSWYIADNTIDGATPYWTQSDEGEGIELNGTSGHTIAHNSITNVADGVSTPRTNVDIFGNDIFNTADDGLELDFGLANVRVWQNRIHNAYHNGISFQPQNGGPWYIIRNQIVGSVESPFKFRTTDRFVLVNNTIVNFAGGLICCNQSHLLRGLVRNNLWVSAQGGQIWNLEALKDWRTDIDYDGFDWGSAAYPLVWAGTIYYDLPSFAAASGLEQHGVRIFREGCFAEFNVPGPTPTEIPPQFMTLRADCNAVDAGAVLPNLTGSIAGAAPDLGAYEYGVPLPQYGPRPANAGPGAIVDSPAAAPVPAPTPPLPVTPAASSVPAFWSNQDVGSVAIGGSVTADGVIWSMTASGADVWGTADAFHFVMQPLTGDGTIVARVTSFTGANAWAKAGVMVRESLDASSPHAFALVTPDGSNGVAFQRRIVASDVSVHTAGPLVGAPVWLKLTRQGTSFTAAWSPDGLVWSVIGSENLPMATTAYVGLAVTSHDAGATAIATFDNVSVTAGQVQDGWESQDVGAVDPPGSTAEGDGALVVTASGADIWGTADAFRMAYRAVSGDFDVTARVAGVEAVNQWTKAGVMVRASLTAGSAHASLFATPSVVKGIAFQRRESTDAASLHTQGPALAPSVWLRLSRRGNIVTAWYRTSLSDTWAVIDTAAIELPATVFVGTAVTSHQEGVLATAVFDNVAIVAAP